MGGIPTGEWIAVNLSVVCRYSFGFKFPEIRLKVNNDISIHRATIDRI